MEFDRRLKLTFHGSKVTLEADLLAFRELDDALRVTEHADQALVDTRTARKACHDVAVETAGAVLDRVTGCG